MARYIDADLMSEAEDRAFLALKERYKNLENYFSYEDVHKRIQLLIKGAPTADVQKVKHGKWRECRFGNGITVPFRKYYICNQCNHTSQKKSRYCPNCGAKMDGKE